MQLLASHLVRRTNKSSLVLSFKKEQTLAGGRRPPADRLSGQCTLLNASSVFVTRSWISVLTNGFVSSSATICALST
jgi:hypothetical protein